MPSRALAMAALCSLAAFSPLSAAKAGQLFPPGNIGSNPSVSCPNGEVLSWEAPGTVECVNPTPGVTVSCPAGQVMTGISNGQPICVLPNTLQIYLRVNTTIGDVNANCDYPADPNPPGYNQLQYNTTCASRFCLNVYAYDFGILTENGPAYDYAQPWNSDPATNVVINCAK